MTVQPPAERPAPGYYPDPSIPGFVRYWDGDAWTPGSARPAPEDGAPLPPPPRAARGGVRVAPPPPPRPASVEETGPVFLDETGAARLIVPSEQEDPAGQEQSGPSVWGASAQAQPGLLDTGSVPHHVSWGIPSASAPGSEASLPSPSMSLPEPEPEPTGSAALPAPAPAPVTETDLDDELASALRLALSQTRRAQLPPLNRYESDTWAQPPGDRAEPDVSAARGAVAPEAAPPTDERAESPGSTPAPREEAHTADAARLDSGHGWASAGYGRTEVAQEGGGAGTSSGDGDAARTVGAGATPAPTPVSPSEGRAQGAGPSVASREDVPGAGAPTLGAGGGLPPADRRGAGVPSAFDSGAGRTTGAGRPTAASPTREGEARPTSDDASRVGGAGARALGAAAAPAPAPVSPSEGRSPGAGPTLASRDVPRAATVSAQPARGGAPTEAGRPAATPQSEAAPSAAETRSGRAASGVGQRRARTIRPALLGPRIGARLVDTVVTYALVAVLGVVLVQRVTLHLQAKIDAAQASGVPQTVWLVDATVLRNAGLLLAALLAVGLLYETIPLAVWGRTLGKAIFGLIVLDARSKARPKLVRTILRTVMCQTLVFLLLGILELVPCATDRRLRQSWHDKLGGTFVARQRG